MKQFSYVIQDKLGIHARPAGLLAKEAAAFPCAVTISKDGKEVDAKRILALMGLCVKCGEKVVISADGEKEEEVIAKLQQFMEENL